MCKYRYLKGKTITNCIGFISNAMDTKMEKTERIGREKLESKERWREYTTTRYQSANTPAEREEKNRIKKLNNINTVTTENYTS